MKVIALHNGFLLTPTYQGPKTILIIESKISQIMDPSKLDAIKKSFQLAEIPITVQDCTGLYICPGFIDSHVHLTGGGGELGPTSRTPEAKLSELIQGGLTTVIGLLGTDGITRSLENLYQKVKGLAQDGMNAFMFTGGYRVPIHTITGSIQRDLILIQPVIGIGEVALSDHRGTYPSFDILVQNVSDCRVGGLLSNKGGIVQVHVGNGKQKLQPLWDIVNETDIPISQFHPTHVSSRGEELVQDVQQWLEQGGSADVTADEPGSFKTCELLNRWKGLDILKRVTISSDAYGSLPVFDKGKLIKYAVASPEACLHTIQRLVKEFNWSLPEVLPLVTSNVAKIYKLGEKGEIKVDYDADIVVLDVQVQVVHVLAKGKWLKQGPFVKKGMFE